MTTTTHTQRSLRRRTLLAAAVCALAAAAAPTAGAVAPPLVDLQVIDRETRQAARIWRRGGRLYVAGRPGARYGLQVTNNTPGRVLVVMSVDGVNILTGETAGYGQRGYVFAPYETYEVSGWRKSDAQVAAFTFATLSRSYATRTGRPHDVGVIGIAAFTERTAPPVALAPAAPEQSAADTLEESVVTGGRRAPPPVLRAAPSGQVARRSERLGTAHGAREWSAVTTVSFQRATSYPKFVRQMEYDSYANLVARGVIPRSTPTPGRPRPFPQENGYVPDPPYGR
ncbi:hypothetical protein [Phenylobacterium sp.]|jgi:hypothetical protein|uniref:hypothetical protein n=1 Tax=Phenylobacterium sp. TaxID=1871053 RepID=UPI002E347E46|nr:hypothetical protein [Phenylobacterium sp.]HEX2559867.1 hypothetical protein [Phenylobacterium sp.]